MSATATRYDHVSMNSTVFSVADASAGVCLFPIPVRSAQALLPGAAFRAASSLPGQGLFGLAFLDQREGSLGAHRQAAFVVAATRPPRARWLGPIPGAIAAARRRVPFHLFQHPVDSELARALGADTFGLPSAVHAIDVRHEPGRVECEVVMHGRHVLTLTIPRGGDARFDGAPLEILSYVGGAPHRASGVCDGEGVTDGGRRVELLLGDHPLADRLRRLGLPKRPARSVYVERLRATVGAPAPIGALER